MKRNLLLLLGGAVVLLVLVGNWLGREKTDARRALRDFRAQLQAQGEKLTWEEWGYPRSLAPDDCVDRMVAALGQIQNRGFSPGYLRWMDVSNATNCEPAWARPELLLLDKNRPTLSWAEFGQELASAHVPLAEVRAALAQPPDRLLTDPTNFSVRPSYQFVTQRNAAHWLAAELIYALRREDHDLARQNLQALQQLIRLHEADPTLVSQMIRAAIAGLALAGTWEALPAEGWTAAELAALQKSWEQINLLRNLELGALGERLFAETYFRQLSGMNSEQQVQYENSLLGGAANRNWDYYWQVFVTTPLWRMNREADELLALQHSQTCLEAIRALQRGTNWAVARRDLSNAFVRLEQIRDQPLGGIRYAMSAVIIPNLQKAAQTTLRHETLRRLTVTAIALKRFELQHHAWPPDLAALVPEFISAVPTDPMSGRALCYQVQPGGFVLYSVGEDGVDDGGNPEPVAEVKEREIWAGKDFVWPVPTTGRRR